MGFLIAALLGPPRFVMLQAEPALLITFKAQGGRRERLAWGLVAWLVSATSMIATWQDAAPIGLVAGPSGILHLVWFLIGRGRRESGRAV